MTDAARTIYRCWELVRAIDDGAGAAVRAMLAQEEPQGGWERLGDTAAKRRLLERSRAAWNALPGGAAWRSRPGAGRPAKPWAPGELERALEMRAAGVPVAQIARELGRPRETVRKRLTGS